MRRQTADRKTFFNPVNFVLGCLMVLVKGRKKTEPALFLHKVRNMDFMLKLMLSS